jgi:hypothetical protein
VHDHPEQTFACDGQGYFGLQGCAAELYRRFEGNHWNHAQIFDTGAAPGSRNEIHATALAFFHVGGLAECIHRHIRSDGRRAPQAECKQVSSHFSNHLNTVRHGTALTLNLTD